MSVTLWACGATTVTCNTCAEMKPCLSSAMISRVCGPGSIQMRVFIELSKVKNTARPSTYTRISKIGFEGMAKATTLAGEFTVAPLPGLEMVSGNGDATGGGGSCAGGAGSELVCGDHVGGVGVGVGEVFGVGDGEGVGVGAGVGVGVGDIGVGVGVGEKVMLEAPPPHPATSRLARNRKAENKS